MAAPFRLADPDQPFVERYLLQWESGHEVRSIGHAIVSNADWMVGNTVLALIPLALAHRLFAVGVRPRALQVLAWAAFIAFLPNALYVVTDLIHLVAEVEQLGWWSAVVLGPIYAVFVAVGVLSYAACFVLMGRWLLERVGRRVAWGVCAVLHVACACGIYLGRVVRLNSWEFVTDPRAVLDGVSTMLVRPEAILYVVTVTFIGLVLALVAGRAAPGIGAIAVMRSARR